MMQVRSRPSLALQKSAAMNETSAPIANILLVDDHGDSLLTMSMLLTSAGYSTATAVNLPKPGNFADPHRLTS